MELSLHIFLFPKCPNVDLNVGRGLSHTDIEAFEKIDESLLRGLVKGHSKGPLAALYGDLGPD